MSTVEHVEACVRFTDVLMRTHRPVAAQIDDPVARCACGRAVVLCEIATTAVDAGLLRAPAGTRSGLVEQPGPAPHAAEANR